MKYTENIEFSKFVEPNTARALGDCIIKVLSKPPLSDGE